jgi:hypothetical protein
MKRIAFEQLALHRIEAGTLPRNAAPQVVLRRNGFVRLRPRPGMVRCTDERLLEYVLGLGQAADHTDELCEEAPVRPGAQLLDLDVAHAVPPSPQRDDSREG